MPAGCAIAEKTDRKQYQYLVSAPTMRVPENVASSQNAYPAMRAILIQCIENEIESIAIPGPCALSGQMPCGIVARQMRVAYDKIIRKTIAYSHWREEKELQRYMLRETSELPHDYESNWMKCGRFGRRGAGPRPRRRRSPRAPNLHLAGRRYRVPPRSSIGPRKGRRQEGPVRRREERVVRGASGT